MPKSSDYRKLADDCLEMAERASPSDRETLLDIAALWLKLATAALESEAAAAREQ
jgi:hypothetical protein